MNIEKIAYPVAGAIMASGWGYGIAEVFSEEGQYEAETAAIEECQDALNDAPQQISDLPDACQRYDDYFAYNYDTGNYYVPAASEVDSFIYVPDAEDDARAEKILKSMFVIIFAPIGAWGRSRYSSQYSSQTCGSRRATGRFTCCRCRYA